MLIHIHVDSDFNIPEVKKTKINVSQIKQF